jgi:predicted TIM-barrel fold metal-dependent hydrolase
MVAIYKEHLMKLSMPRSMPEELLITLLLIVSLMPSATTAAEMPVIDAHIHYSHDAWDVVPPENAVAILREAGLKKALVSSSSDEGTQKLYAVAPDLVVPVLRPYRKRGETSSWKHDETVVAMLSERLSKNRYAGIGEFHASGEDIELPVLQQVIALAKKYGIYLHAHVDSVAIHRIFKHNPDALVLWAHSGFDDPDKIRTMLDKYPNLWSDLAFRSEQASQGQVVTGWRELFIDFPDRFVLGTDTYTPDRWFDVVGNAEWSREWLKSLPKAVAKNIAYRNAEALLEKVSFE